MPRSKPAIARRAATRREPDAFRYDLARKARPDNGPGSRPRTSRDRRRQGSNNDEAQPLLDQRGHETQAYGSVVRMPIALEPDLCRRTCEGLNQILADTITLRDLYKKHHWQVSGHTFYQLHLLFDKHAGEQTELVDTIAERIQLLGGLSIAMAHDVAELTRIPRPPRGREEVPVQISRLLEAHEIVLKEARQLASQAADAGDDGTNDMLVSDVIRTNEFQAWFVAEHVVDTPVVRAE